MTTGDEYGRGSTTDTTGAPVEQPVGATPADQWDPADGTAIGAPPPAPEDAPVLLPVDAPDETGSVAAGDAVVGRDQAGYDDDRTRYADAGGRADDGLGRHADLEGQDTGGRPAEGQYAGAPADFTDADATARFDDPRSRFDDAPSRRDDDRLPGEDRPVADATAGRGAAVGDPGSGPTASPAATDWRELQSLFVDDPAAAVRAAGTAVEQALDALRDEISRSRDQGGDTEALRTAFRRYRDLHRALG